MTPIKGGLGIIVGGCAYLVGGFDKDIKFLVIAIILDYVFGILSAVSQQKYSFKIAYMGLIKKVGYFGIIMVSVLIERAMGQGVIFHPLVCYYLIGTEAFSLLKTFKDLGLPIPDIFEKEVSDFMQKFNKS